MRGWGIVAVTGTLVAVLGLALVDSINPSALVMTLHLLTRAVPVSRIWAYIGAILVTYLTIGILLMLGVDALLGAFRDVFETPAAYAVQGVIGAAMLIYSFRPVTASDPSDRRAERAATTALVGMFALGAMITVAEFPTAFPYLGAIALLTQADLTPGQWLPVLLVYNVIFVVPPSVLVIGHQVAGRRLGARYERLRQRLQRGAQETVLWIIGIVGFFLVVDSLAYFEFFGLIESPGWARTR